MGHRLSRITTRTGDDGSTGLGDGSRTGKDDLRIEAIGAIDELNCQIGLLLTQPLPEDTTSLLTRIQHDLFDLGGELSIPGRTILDTGDIARLEQQLDTLNHGLAPLKEFILPGGCHSAAHAHVARGICRRAERRLVALHQREAVSDSALGYLNRLSDLLFVLARYLNQQQGQGDRLWQPKRQRGVLPERNR